MYKSDLLLKSKKSTFYVKKYKKFPTIFPINHS